ncbi:hypothetical protein OIPHN260_30890 [Enterobacter roggenkampii]|uniref:Uncharacterized protein n=1 Tax=Enterobacter roggenkampii TaxID=1812935 RepID=A0AAU9BWI5_9ENTR|nr:hypothetical protein OIPHN260_30890 [Enterobacter roggenkampii]
MTLSYRPKIVIIGTINCSQKTKSKSIIARGNLCANFGQLHSLTMDSFFSNAVIKFDE